MVHAAGERLDDALHLELEEQGGQLSDGDAGLHAENVQLQVVSLLEQTDDATFLRREVRKQSPFDALDLGLLA